MTESTSEVKTLVAMMKELSDITNDTSIADYKGRRKGILIQWIIKPKYDERFIVEMFPGRYERMSHVIQTIIQISSQRFTTVKTFALFLDVFMEIMYMNQEVLQRMNNEYYEDRLAMLANAAQMEG